MAHPVELHCFYLCIKEFFNPFVVTFRTSAEKVCLLVTVCES